ncbi:MAG TPA: diaminopimelate epimerase [Flavobacteriaceae bacterium]|nr:diaminopimelate epimerase [Flavobacteriaceae bacterium]
MKITFYKYQGTGNDFIIIDNRQLVFNKNNTNLIAEMCDRKFGIGADGLLLLEADSDTDFRMIYFNADGQQSSMCGNGGRCIVHFAAFLGIISNSTTFQAIDGIHNAEILSNDTISLQMNPVTEIKDAGSNIFLDTGSPHHVEMVENLETYDVVKNGSNLRYKMYGESGANINFVEQINETTFAVRTYERGVENETLSCGTGVTAVAIAMYHQHKTPHQNITLKTPGGDLGVRFTVENETYKNVFLTGPAKQVFKGIWKC